MANHVPDHLKDHFVVRQKIWKRCRHKNQHFIGCIVGREGTGKSWTAIRIAELADPDFDHNKILFDPDELVERLREGEVEKGDVFVLDEAGVGVGNRTWYDPEQIHFNQILQIIRDHNCAVIFTLPRGKELDEQSRGRLVGYWETESINRDAGYVVTRYKNINPDRKPHGGADIYEKYPRRYENGVEYKVKKHRYYAPSQDIIEPYEERKTEFQQREYEKHITGDESEEEQGLSASEVAEKIAEEGIGPYVGVHGGNGTRYIDAQLIEADYGLSQREAKKAKKLLERNPDVSVEDAQTDQSSQTAHTA